MRLLVVEDNEELSNLIAKGLRAAGYTVDLLARADDAKALILSNVFSAVILDLGLPDADGLTVLQELRAAKNSTPILVLTARSGIHDRVTGLRSGADDYMVKPFAFDELLARIEALLRRPGQMLSQSLQIANLKFDTQSRQAFIDDIPLPISAREAALLELLMRRAGNIVSKRLVEDQMFGLEDVASNAIEVYIHRLRKQLSAGGARIKIINMRGLGYTIVEDN